MIGGEAPLEYGGAPTVINPGGGTPVLPALPAESPTELSPAPIEKPPTSTIEPPGPTGSKSSTNKTNYEAARPRYKLGQNDGGNVSRTMASTSEPTFGSAQGSVAASSESWLDNLPPLTVPRDESRNPLPEPAPPAAVAETSGRKPAPAADAPLVNSNEVSVAPGIHRFVAVEPRLSGGSLPSSAGLDWLAEKGYRTVLDLRETSDVQPSFIDEVTNRGLRYVALPIGLKTLDAAHVSRFNLELSLSDGRPIYFCDTDGTRSGALWYIHRMTLEKVDEPEVRREATELGLVDKTFWKAATSYLESRKAPSNPPQPDPPAASNELQPPTSPATSLEPAAAVVPEDQITQIEQIPVESLERVDSRDTTGWRSYAALVVTGLGVPLAYMSRASIPSLRSWSRASLPAARRQPKSLPAASGE